MDNTNSKKNSKNIKINKANLNNYFISSEKNLKKKFNFDKIINAKEFETIDETKIINKNKINQLSNKKTESYLPVFEESKLNATKFPDENINLNEDILTSENKTKCSSLNYKENLNLNNLQNFITTTNCNISYISEIKNNNGNISTRNKGNNKSSNNNNISNNPNISIYNNFIFSFNKNDKIPNLLKDNSNHISNNTKGNNININLNNISCLNNNIVTNINNNNNINNDFVNDFHGKFSTKDNKKDTFPISIKKNIKNEENKTDRPISKKIENLGSLEVGNINSKSNFNPHDCNFPKHYFSLGYIFLILICKGIKLKVFEYLDNFSINNMEEMKKFRVKKCCLVHFLISLEEELNINKKHSVEIFFNKFSENFKNFICNITTISLSNRHKTKKKCLQGKHIFNLNA